MKFEFLDMLSRHERELGSPSIFIQGELKRLLGSEFKYAGNMGAACQGVSERRFANIDRDPVKSRDFEAVLDQWLDSASVKSSPVLKAMLGRKK